ncbi:MAG TPA: YIP1 family protein [Drouetiella sp.]|jgi:hypothetical protein
MSESEVTLPATSNSTNEINQWADIFYGLLVAPIRTIEILTDDEALGATYKTVLGAAVIVLLANGISGCVDAGTSGVRPTLPVLISAEFQGIVMWIALSALVHIICGWVSKRDVSFTTSLVGVGWAFMPLVFAAPLSCFRFLGIFYNLLAAIPILWMVYLQWLVFNHSLSIASVKMFALLVLGPPLFIITYLFWLSAACLAVAQFFM